MGALVTLELPADSPALLLPWIITIGPLSDEEDWEAVVCGPYERAHALALAAEIVADDELMAVVEPVMPHVSVDAIREEIATARALAVEEDDDEGDTDLADEAGEDDEDGEDEDGDEGDENEDEDEADDGEHPGAPTPDEIRSGFARIAARLTER